MAVKNNHIYTPKEIREAALLAETVEVPDEFYGHEMDKIAAMLRQAADALEREKRVKKYEYGIRYYVDDGSVFEEERHCDSINEAKEISDISGYDELRFFRRSVGEWEEIEDEVQNS